MNLFKNQTIREIIATLIGGIAFFLTLYVIIFVEPGYYHSDCTDSIMWAQASYDAGRFVNPDFHYAGILPLGGNLIMWPLVALFGVGMKAQIIGIIIFFLLFLLSVIWLCRQLSFHGNWTSFAVAVILTVLLSSEKLREIFWGHIIYYSLGALLLAAVLASTLRCMKLYEAACAEKESKKRKQYVCFALLAVFCFISAVNGFQILSLSVIPVLAAVAAYVFFDMKTKIGAKSNYSKFFVMLLMAAACVLGIMMTNLFTGGVEAGYEQAFSSFSESENWVNNFLSIFPHFLTLTGVDVTTDLILFSGGGIISLIKIICALVLMIVPVVMLLFYRRFESREYKIVLLAHHFLTLIILVGWTFGKLNAANWRLSPILVTSALCCVIFAKWIYETEKVKRPALLIIIPLVCILAVTSAQLVTVKKQSDENARLEGLAEYLEQQNLQYGYATFWNANVVTMMSDSKVIIRSVEFDDSGVSPLYYQSNQNWYGTVQNYAKYFLVLTGTEYSSYYSKIIAEKPPEDTKQYGDYTILIYNQNIF